jgi:hypothetical protein
MKKAGFSQGIYQTSSTQKESLGTRRALKDGREFVYAQAGGSDLAAGKLGVSAAINADHANEAILAAVAIGVKTLSVTVTAGTAIAANALAEGALQINDATGEGYSYTIASNSAITASETVVNLTLDEGIKVALDTTSEFTLVHNPWKGIVEDTTAACPVGVPVVAVTTLYYYWAQTKGLACVLMGATVALGTDVIQDASVAGSTDIMATASVIPAVGTVHGLAGVDTEYQPVILKIT